MPNKLGSGMEKLKPGLCCPWAKTVFSWFPKPPGGTTSASWAKRAQASGSSENLASRDRPATSFKTFIITLRLLVRFLGSLCRLSPLTSVLRAEFGLLSELLRLSEASVECVNRLRLERLVGSQSITLAADSGGHPSELSFAGNVPSTNLPGLEWRRAGCSFKVQRKICLVCSSAKQKFASRVRGWRSSSSGDADRCRRK